MASADWDLGRPRKTITLAAPKSELDGRAKPVTEVFRITRYERGVVIRATRPLDHVDLLFTVRGYTCVGLGATNGQPRLRRLRMVADRKLRVLLAPQHIAEQIKDKPQGPGGCESAAAWGAMRVRLSQPSRLVFAIPTPWEPRLVLSELTDWSTLVPLVHRRAGVGAEVEQQLAVGLAELDQADWPTTNLATALDRISNGLTGPDEGETALEMPGRLILSPAAEGRWLVPGELPAGRTAPLWTARLDRAGRASVRAIWSSRLKPGRMPADTNEPIEPGGRMLSLSLRNHWDIVAQTSVYGLPALRRLGVPAAQDASIALPRATVVRPRSEIGYLNEIDAARGHLNQDSGIALATPFDDADISASALGGIAALEWKGEPPQVFKTIGNPEGFRLERLSYAGFLGRDSKVVAAEKGYLFPLGIRASLVTVHERNIYPDANGDPVSYLIRRQFIATPRRPRTYPGPYQPFDGREFPARRIVLKTQATPDLVTIENIVLGLPLPDESVFWPRISQDGRTSDVLFEWATEDAVAVRSKLIFVSNAVVGRQDVMRALVAAYNKEADDRRTAWLGGARHRYGEPAREGDTSFDTASWRLRAQGRRDGVDGTEHFAIDGRMEGADQPPFYPLLEDALINVQSIEQMIGTPQGPVRVGYYADYVEKGFATPHGIYLKIAGTDLELKASQKTERSGGIASPDLRAAAISRITGLVGGSAPGPLVGSAPGVDLDFSDAAAGAFNPKQFFGDAKLLGVVSLSEIVAVAAAQGLAAAPQLIDQTLYGARAVFEQVRSVARTARDALYVGTGGLVPRLENGIDQADAFLLTANLTLVKVYPSLMIALQPLRPGGVQPLPPADQPIPPGRVLQLLDAIVAASDAEAGRAPIAALVPIVRDLLAAAAAVIKDPVPDTFEAAIERVQAFFEALFDGAEAQVRLFAAAIVERAQAWLKDAFCAAVDGEDFGQILFGARGELSCDDLFDDPEAAARAFAEGLYGPVLERALAEMDDVLARAADVQARLDLLLDRGRAAIAAALEAGVRLIEDRLALLDPALDDIRTAARKAAFVDAVLADVRPLLTPPAGAMTAERALEFVDGVAARLESDAEQATGARLAALLPAIRAAAGVDPETLLAELSALALGRLRAEFVAPLARDIDRVRGRLRILVAQTARGGFERIVALVTGLFDALLKSKQIADIAGAGRAVRDICDKVTAAALLIGDGVMAPTARIEAAAQAILDAIAQIDPPMGEPGAALREALEVLGAAASKVIETGEAIETERARLRVLTSGICAAVRDHLDPLAAVIRLRRAVATMLLDMARQCAAIGALFAAGDPTPQEQAALGEATRACAELCLHLTGAGNLPGPAQAAVLTDAAASIGDAAIGDQAYRDALADALREALARAAGLRAALTGAIDPQRLRRVIEGQAAPFADWLDRKLTAYLMQSVGLTPSIIAAIDAAVLAALKPFCAALLPIYDALGGALELIFGDPPADPVLAAVYRLALGGDAKVQAIEDALTALAAERDRVAAIANAPGPVALADVAALVAAYRNGQGALTKVIAAVDGLGLVDVGQTLTQAIREQLKLIEEEARALVRQFVPTKLETRYFWTTELKTVPPGNAWIFKPTSEPPPQWPTEPPVGHPIRTAGRQWHLWLDSRFSFDIVTRKREVEITGVLRPFELWLLGDEFDMLTIVFDETRFRSVNGATPTFDVKVRTVKIGRYLRFIERLQQWLTPQGSGFYVRPADRFAGIEVGYVYDAGLIQVGSLQFINVAFRVAAILPFSADSVSKGKATFVFALAGPDRPFLISSPPYGGGGWVTITCDAEQVRELDLAFVFGGVAALKFGPLDAQGRIVAGVRVQSMTAGDKRAYVITAIFEAVGEGSIACFSISVSIRVTLTQTSGGALYGATTYRFTFKVGFVRLKYSVTARYRLSNKKEANLRAQLLAAPGAGWVRATAPPKESRWQAYRRHFDLSLLEDA